MKFTAEEIFEIVKNIAKKHGVEATQEGTGEWCCWAAGEEWESKEELASCLETEDFGCKHCGFVTRLEYLRDGLCQDCWDERFFECNDCHEVYETHDNVIYRKGCDEWDLCRKCASDKHYVMCGCGDCVAERKGDYTQPQEFVCDICKKN